MRFISTLVDIGIALFVLEVLCCEVKGEVLNRTAIAQWVIILYIEDDYATTQLAHSRSLTEGPQQCCSIALV